MFSSIEYTRKSLSWYKRMMDIESHMRFRIDNPKDMINTGKSLNKFCKGSCITYRNSHYLFLKLMIRRLVHRRHQMDMKRGMKFHRGIYCYLNREYSYLHSGRFYTPDYKLRMFLVSGHQKNRFHNH